MAIDEILQAIDFYDGKDIMKESVEERLKNSLERYYEEVEFSYRDLLRDDYIDVVKSIIKKYDNHMDDYLKMMEESKND